MEDHGTAFPNWYITFQQAALAALPRPPQIDKGTALGWANNGKEMRKAFLQALVPPTVPAVSLLLEAVGTVEISAIAERFVTQEKFVVNTSRKAPVKISYIGDNFREWFLGKIEEPMTEATLRHAKLLKYSADGTILAELGNTQETALAQVYALMKCQPNGESGALLTNGYANIFYVVDINGILRAVCVHWVGGGWGVSASSVGDPGRWDDGSRVFSRNSLPSVPVAV